MGTCRSCGNDVDEGARFCGTCGTIAPSGAADDAPPVGGAPDDPGPSADDDIDVNSTVLISDLRAREAARAPSAPPPPGAPPAPPPPGAAPPPPVSPPPGAPPPPGATAPGPAPQWSPGAPPPVPPPGAPPGAPSSGQSWPPGGPQLPPDQSGQAGAGGGGGRGTRVLLVVVGLVVLVVLLVAAVLVVPRLLGGSDDDGALTGPDGLPITASGPTSEPEEEWSASIDCEDGCDLAADDAAVFVARIDADGSGESSTEVTAYDPSSGDERWTESFDGDVGLDVLDEGLLLQAVDDDSGTLTLVDASDGEERWSADGSLRGVYDGDLLVDDGDDGLVLDAASGEERLSVDGGLLSCGTDVLLRSDGDEVDRVSDSDGEDQWDASLDTGSTVNAGCDGDTLVLVDDDGDLTAISLSDGEERASGETDLESVDALIVDGDQVTAVGDGDAIGYRLSGDALEESWTAGVGGSPRVDLGGGQQLFVDDGADAEVLDLGDGESQGRARLSGFDFQTIVTTESLIAVGEDGAAAFALDDLEDRWEVDLPDDASEVTVGGSRLFVRTPDELVAYG